MSFQLYKQTIIFQLVNLVGAARGLVGSRHLVFKIADFTDVHPIFEKIRALFYTQTPTETALVSI